MGLNAKGPVIGFASRGSEVRILPPRSTRTDTKIVQERLGHAKVGKTLDIDSHVTPGLQEAAALRFEECLAVTNPPEPTPVPITR
jgi:hypothetical protein